MQEIKIIIENLKKIKKLEFNLKLEKGIYAIVGNNGTGKSSLMICIAKLVKPSIFKEEFSGGINNFETAKITYFTPYGVDIIWEKKPNWYAKENYEFMPKFKGFFESSILTGTRFFHLDNKNKILSNKNIQNSKEASDFIKKSMDYIINGEQTNFFDNLKYTDIDYKKRLYYIDLGDKKYITEFNFSTGEYFLLSILKIIQTFSNRRNKEELGLLIIDEIDIALHPLAQKRFIEMLQQWMNNFNLLVIFATHSLPILEHLDANNIYHIENNKIYNPIYPAYLTSKLFQHTYYDKIILVEDKLASKYIENILIDLQLERILYKIIPIGGWEKVLEIYSQNTKYAYFSNADIFCILDGDIENQANKNPYKKIEKRFLPFCNIEKICIENIFIESDLTNQINSLIYPKKIFDLDIEEFKNTDIDISKMKTEKIKNIFKKLITEISKHSEKENIEIENIIIGTIYENFKTVDKHISLVNDLKYFFDNRKLTKPWKMNNIL